MARQAAKFVRGKIGSDVTHVVASPSGRERDGRELRVRGQIMIGGLSGTSRGNHACTVHVGGILTKTSSLAWCRDFCRRFTQTVRGSRGVIAEERPARKLLLLASLLDVAVLDGGAERGRLQELEERERVRVLYVLAVRRLGPVEQVLEEHHEALVVEVPVHGKVVQVRRVGEAGYELEFERESLLFCGCRDDAWWLSCRAPPRLWSPEWETAL